MINSALDKDVHTTWALLVELSGEAPWEWRTSARGVKPPGTPWTWLRIALLLPARLCASSVYLSPKSCPEAG